MKRWSPDFTRALEASSTVIVIMFSVTVIFFLKPFLDSLPGNFFYTSCSGRTQRCNEYGIYTGIALLLVAALAVFYIKYKNISLPIRFNEKVKYNMTQFEKLLHFLLLVTTAIMFIVTVGYLGAIL